MRQPPRRPPAGLGAPGRSLWRSVVAAYELALHEVVILRQACLVADLIERVDAELATSPLVVAGHAGQPRPSPLLGASAQQRAALKSLLGSLGLLGDRDEPPRRLSRFNLMDWPEAGAT